ncbi:histone-lysine N-methyltransferase, H3 lysine-79 specific-like [Clytia hemisphaerica]|uniref:Uncharacterized protein n=1 Tax=Clytia hemisphaerica TaxID=252671 RepID=A0A7M5WQG9_9CNID
MWRMFIWVVVMEIIQHSAGWTLPYSVASCRTQCEGTNVHQRSCIQKCIQCIHCQSAIVQPYFVYPQIPQYQMIQQQQHQQQQQFCQGCPNSMSAQTQPKTTPLSSNQINLQQQAQPAFLMNAQQFLDQPNGATLPQGSVFPPHTVQTPPLIMPTKSMSQSSCVNSPPTPSAINSDLDIDTSKMITELEKKQRQRKEKLRAKNKLRERKKKLMDEKKRRKNKQQNKNTPNNKWKSRMNNSKKKLSEKLKMKGKKLPKQETLRQQKEKQFGDRNIEWNAKHKKTKKVWNQRIEKTKKKIKKHEKSKNNKVAKTPNLFPLKRPSTTAGLSASQMLGNCPCNPYLTATQTFGSCPCSSYLAPQIQGGCPCNMYMATQVLANCPCKSYPSIQTLRTCPCIVVCPCGG